MERAKGCRRPPAEKKRAGPARFIKLARQEMGKNTIA